LQFCHQAFTEKIPNNLSIEVNRELIIMYGTLIGNHGCCVGRNVNFGFDATVAADFELAPLRVK
jgi:hypothetical protein